MYDSSPRLIFIVLSLFLLFLGIVNSKILTPLNKLWFSFGIILGAVISPIVMCLVFFLVLTPIGILVKILRKDLLLIKYDKTKKTYWIKRTNVAGTMKRQF